MGPLSGAWKNTLPITVVYRRKLTFKAELESTLSCFSFKRPVPEERGERARCVSIYEEATGFRLGPRAQFQALSTWVKLPSSRRFQLGFDRVKLHRLTVVSTRLAHTATCVHRLKWMVC
jgi:hypothetical protein